MNKVLMLELLDLKVHSEYGSVMDMSIEQAQAHGGAGPQGKGDQVSTSTALALPGVVVGPFLVKKIFEILHV